MGRKSKPGRKFGMVFVRQILAEINPGTVVSPKVGTSVQEEIDLELDFEGNEVFDIGMIESWIYSDGDSLDPAVTATQNFVIGISEFPNFARTLLLDTTVETDPSLIYLDRWTLRTEVDATATAGLKIAQRSRYKQVQFPDWYTVAQNLTGAASAEEGAATSDEYQVMFNIYGRRRRAPDKEFRLLINQLRR